LASLPMRHDRPDLDVKIGRINSEIERIAEDYLQTELLALHLLPRHFFTHHGLHFNKRGKANIAGLVSSMTTKNKQVDKEKKETVKVMKINGTRKINVVEADIFDAMDQWKLDPTAAFAHTISADFSHRRHMSAGIAVNFRRKWGKPVASDYVADRLTCQKVMNKAVVYSLVTKSEYFAKPTLKDYDSAFTQLTDVY